MYAGGVASPGPAVLGFFVLGFCLRLQSNVRFSLANSTGQRNTF
jgi:hypothetical protein